MVSLSPGKGARMLFVNADFFKLRETRGYDLLMRMPLLAWSIFSATMQMGGLAHYLRQADPGLPSAVYAINVAMRFSTIFFLLLMAAAVVSAHNHVLRRWLRGQSPDPIREVDEAMRQVIALFAPRIPDPDAAGTTVVAFRSGQPLETLLPAIQEALGAPDVVAEGTASRPDPVL